MYVVAMSKDSSSNYHQRLHALDITSGAEEFGGPVDIAAQYPGTGDNSQNGEVIFDPKQYKERAGLLLLNHVVYTSWALTLRRPAVYRMDHQLQRGNIGAAVGAQRDSERQ